MRLIYVLFICILFSNCNGKSDKISTFNALKNTVWIDSLCNEFHFKDSTISKKLLYQENLFLDPIGKLKFNNEIELEFDYGNDNIEKYNLESKLNGKLVFRALDKYNDNLILIKADSIKKTGLEILELQLKIRPSFLSSSGLRDLTITKDKKIEYRRAENKYELEKATMSDSTFNQLEKYLEILQFDKYRYHLDGKIFETTTYNENGIKILVEQFKNEKLTYSCQYSGKTKHGLELYYGKDGEKMTYRCEFINGKKNGKEYCLNEDGTETNKEYLNGKKIK